MTTNTYGTGSTYAFGQVVSSTSDTYTNNGNSTSGSPDSETSTTNTYIWRGGPLLSTIIYDEDTTDSGSTDRVTTNTYSTLSALTNADIADGRARDADYITDHSGQVIRRDETDGNTGAGNGDPHEVWHRFGGKQMGYVGNNGTTNTDYEASIADRTTTPDSNHTTQGAFRHGEHQSDPYSDFDQSYDRINSYNQGATAGTYTVRGGETLAAIAQTIYGDSGLWYKLAEANGLSASSNLSAGTTLRLPTGVIRNINNAGTFTPYNPGDAIGDVSPTAPEPPKDSKDCGAFGQVMMAIVAVSVTIMTGSPVLGNIASQGVGIITGIQDKFSFKSLGMAYITAGLNKLNVGAKVAQAVGAKSALSQAVVGGAINSAAAQGIGVATGLQDKFSWSGVAAAGIGAGIGHVVGDALPGSAGYTADENGIFNVTSKASFGNSVISNTASAIANAATRSALDGTNFGDNVVAAIPDVVGQTFGGLLGNDLSKAFGDLGPISDIIGGINSLTNFVYNQAETAGNEIAGVIGSLGRSNTAVQPGEFNLNGEYKFIQIASDPQQQEIDPGGYNDMEKYLDRLFGDTAQGHNPNLGGDPRYGATMEKLEALGYGLKKPKYLNNALRNTTRSSIRIAIEGEITLAAKSVLSEFVDGVEPTVLTSNADANWVIGSVSAGASDIIDAFISNSNAEASLNFGKTPHLRVYNGPTHEFFELMGGNNADYFKAQVSGAIGYMLNKYDGNIPNGATLTEYSNSKAGIKMLSNTIFARVGDGTLDMSDVVGTFSSGLNAYASDGRINFYARNNTTLSSFWGANALNHDFIREPIPGAPLSAVSQVFTFNIPNPYLPRGPKI